MILDCYEFYLWSLGELRLPSKRKQNFNHPLEGEESNER